MSRYVRVLKRVTLCASTETCHVVCVTVWVTEIAMLYGERNRYCLTILGPILIQNQ